MADENKVDEQSEVVEVELLIPITVRFTKPRYEVISSVADRHHKSKADIVRLAVDDRLLKYLGVQNYTTPKQEEIIIMLTNKIFNEITKVRLELNRIGCNYNQEVRLLHLKQKMKEAKTNIGLRELADEYAEVESGVGVVKTDEMQKLFDRYEDALERTIELMNRLL